MSGSKRITGTALGLGLCATLLSASGLAGPISGKKNLICASSHVVGCAGGTCLQGAPATFDLMTFLFVDVAKKQVHGVDEEGNEAFSPVKNFETTEQAIILQGFENHRGWTMGINRADGSLNMSSTGSDVNFIITGNCIER